MSEALNYGETGFNLVIQALQNDSLPVRQSVCKFLIDKSKPQLHQALLNCSAVDSLTFLNVSNSCLTEEMVERLKQLNVEVITETRKYPEDRYCSVAE